ncbi:ANKHD1 [Symbiodinium necroappetens]|uniref:ANKHD1 protein n=1 Tax=Symbiodinium necroappetens TaxID=1628268 RepID=A0A813AYT5_9DINO|nr:ANKHD1 [Symbiodinium necroappetens]
MLRVRNLTGRELVTSTEAEVAALADAHGSVIRGIEQLLSPLVGQPCFRLKLLCGDAVMDQDAALKLPLELQVAVSDFAEFDAGDVDRLSDASEANDAAAVEALLRRPQNPDLVDSQGRTALIAAAGSGALKSLKLLVSACADLNKPCTPTGATAVFTAKNGMTPVIEAVDRRHLHVVRFLIEKRADIDRTSKRGLTPLFLASQNGYFDMASLLIEMGADKNKAINKGATPLAIARGNGHLDVASLLIENGAEDDGVAPGRGGGVFAK